MNSPRTGADTRSQAGRNQGLAALKSELIASWLRFYAVDDPRDLDLGTLISIDELVRDGVEPPSFDRSDQNIAVR